METKLTSSIKEVYEYNNTMSENARKTRHMIWFWTDKSADITSSEEEDSQTGTDKLDVNSFTIK